MLFPYNLTRFFKNTNPIPFRPFRYPIFKSLDSNPQFQWRPLQPCSVTKNYTRAIVYKISIASTRLITPPTMSSEEELNSSSEPEVDASDESDNDPASEPEIDDENGTHPSPSLPHNH